MRSYVLIRPMDFFAGRSEDVLTESGRDMASLMGRGLKRHFGGRAFTVMSGTAPEAQETAEIIAAELLFKGKVQREKAFDIHAYERTLINRGLRPYLSDEYRDVVCVAHPSTIMRYAFRRLSPLSQPDRLNILNTIPLLERRELPGVSAVLNKFDVPNMYDHWNSALTFHFQDGKLDKVMRRLTPWRDLGFDSYERLVIPLY